MLDGSIAGAVGQRADLRDVEPPPPACPSTCSENLETKHVGDEVHPGESVEEKISLSERFGLWISFYPFTQDDYLAAVGGWLDALRCRARRGARATREARTREALQCALQRGSRSGRVAWQFAQGYAGARRRRERAAARERACA